MPFKMTIKVLYQSVSQQSLQVACFCTQLTVLAGWAPNTAIILYTTTPHMRSLASALNILISHLLGDALSPTIQGKVSEPLLFYFNDETLFRW